MARSLSPTNLLRSSGPLTLMKLVPAAAITREMRLRGRPTALVSNGFRKESLAASRWTVPVGASQHERNCSTGRGTRARRRGIAARDAGNCAGVENFQNLEGNACSSMGRGGERGREKHRCGCLMGSVMAN